MVATQLPEPVHETSHESPHNGDGDPDECELTCNEAHADCLDGCQTTLEDCLNQCNGAHNGCNANCDGALNTCLVMC